MLALSCEPRFFQSYCTQAARVQRSQLRASDEFEPSFPESAVPHVLDISAPFGFALAPCAPWILSFLSLVAQPFTRRTATPNPAMQRIRSGCHASCLRTLRASLRGSLIFVSLGAKMRFRHKEHFRWKEPKAFLALNDAFERSTLSWWLQPLMALVGGALLMGSWYLARFNPQKHPPALPTAISLAILFGVFTAYIVPWMISLCPSEVRFYDTYFMRTRGNTHRQIKYRDLTTFSWRECDDFSTLILKHRRRKREILLGVPSEIPRDAISQFLLDHNVQFEPSA